MTAAVRLADGNSYLRNGCFTVCEHQFGTVVDDAGILLTRSAEETGNVNKRENLNVESIAETYETGCFAGCIAVKHTGEPVGLVGDDTCRATVETGETADDIFCVVFLNFHEVAVVHDSVDNIFHVIRFVRVVRNNLVEAVIYTCGIVLALEDGSLFHVVLRNERDKAANLSHCLVLCGSNEVCHT